MTHTPWWDAPLVALDTETTGPDPDTARIVTAHVSLVDHLGGAEGRTLVVDPGVPIPDEAAAVHGYTTERVAAEGMERSFGLGVLWGLLSRLATHHPVVAFNAAFDCTVLDREFRRAGLTPLNLRPVIDPFVLDKAVDTYRRGKRTLTDVAGLYGVELLDAHEASSDALAAVGIARAIGRRYGGAGSAFGLGHVSPYADELHEQQRAWRAEQCRSLQQYLRRTDPHAVVEPTWPTHPLPATWSPA